MKKSDAVAYFGTQDALAEFLDVSPQAVSQWPGEHIPRGHQLEIQMHTKGKLMADRRESSRKRKRAS